MSRWLWLLLAGLLLAFSVRAEHDRAAPVVVIVHPDTPVGELTPGRLRAIFAMRLRRWPDGSEIHVLTLPPDSPLFEAFSRHCLNVPATLIARIWTRNRYTGMGWVPQQVADPAQMLAQVRRLRGAIGFVRLDDQTPPAGVRVLREVCQ